MCAYVSYLLTYRKATCSQVDDLSLDTSPIWPTLVPGIHLPFDTLGHFDFNATKEREREEMMHQIKLNTIQFKPRIKG